MPRRIHEAMRYCVLSGGKRFRPLLCLGACEAAGASAEQALPVACAVELIHAYSLVHDDLPAMDNAELRRGQPACHRRYGEGNAILVGDALLTLAFELLSGDGLPHTLAIIRTISRASGTTGLIGGQVLDLEVLGGGRRPTTSLLTEIAKRKTAALIAASVVAGALAAGAPRQRLRSLERYGADLGLAFQLIDDVHDHEGLAQSMGRRAAHARARRLIERAIQALAPFGSRAEVLRVLARWLAATAKGSAA